MPGDLRTVLLDERAKQRTGTVDGHLPFLRELLEASYLSQLSKSVRSDAAWPELANRFESKSQFDNQLGCLSSFRDPLAHGRSTDDSIRRNGKEVILWFQERMQSPV